MRESVSERERERVSESLRERVRGRQRESLIVRERERDNPYVKQESGGRKFNTFIRPAGYIL